jgi:U4/U6.U5 tri-snRNP component SNU23
MSNLNYKQVANVERRTWDAEAYEKKAAARKQQQEGTEGEGRTNKQSSSDAAAAAEKEEFKAAPAGAAGPEGSKRAFLQARTAKVEIDERVGETVMVSVEEAAAAGASTSSDNVVKKTGVGWHCSVCDCFLKDSLTYLDHINGRKHQRKLGYSMRVERSTGSDLLLKLNQLKQKKQAVAKEEETSYDKLVQDKDEQEQRRKEERQRMRKERKKLQKEMEPEEQPGEDGEEEEVEGIDPDMAAMMGFAGFGGGNKNH